MRSYSPMVRLIFTMLAGTRSSMVSSCFMTSSYQPWARGDMCVFCCADITGRSCVARRDDTCDWCAFVHSTGLAPIAGVAVSARVAGFRVLLAPRPGDLPQDGELAEVIGVVLCHRHDRRQRGVARAGDRRRELHH